MQYSISWTSSSLRLRIAGLRRLASYGMSPSLHVVTWARVQSLIHPVPRPKYTKNHVLAEHQPIRSFWLRITSKLLSANVTQPSIPPSSQVIQRIGILCRPTDRSRDSRHHRPRLWSIMKCKCRPDGNPSYPTVIGDRTLSSNSGTTRLALDLF